MHAQCILSRMFNNVMPNSKVIYLKHPAFFVIMCKSFQTFMELLSQTDAGGRQNGGVEGATADGQGGAGGCDDGRRRGGFGLMRGCEI